MEQFAERCRNVSDFDESESADVEFYKLRTIALKRLHIDREHIAEACHHFTNILLDGIEKAFLSWVKTDLKYSSPR